MISRADHRKSEYRFGKVIEFMLRNELSKKFWSYPMDMIRLITKFALELTLSFENSILTGNKLEFFDNNPSVLHCGKAQGYKTVLMSEKYSVTSGIHTWRIQTQRNVPNTGERTFWLTVGIGIVGIRYEPGKFGDQKYMQMNVEQNTLSFKGITKMDTEFDDITFVVKNCDFKKIGGIDAKFVPRFVIGSDEVFIQLSKIENDIFGQSASDVMFFDMVEFEHF
ncbi:hypothetical protein RFI_11861 [Reticulomyxa filosa]|uniref:Uncharacterized protein n=1 Tax=Reticulomyxa filosa TaxID=46433 RepID=X6NIV0_RETFI|nr:hypothetical protein RFI_11861 [Reticulomyxa filosa]|eukprot:ETO25277.1 hypothetical protein RFI_11861 [Reticulomyxa filosa]